MTDKQPGFFGVPETNPQVTLMALVADMSAIRATTTDTNRRLDAFEKVLCEIQDLTRTVVQTQAQASNNQRRIEVLETRAETIDRNVDLIAIHAKRLETLEKDLIPNGEFRMAGLEKARTWVISVVGTAMVSGLGWFAVTYLVPLLPKH